MAHFANAIKILSAFALIVSICKADFCDNKQTCDECLKSIECAWCVKEDSVSCITNSKIIVINCLSVKLMPTFLSVVYNKLIRSYFTTWDTSIFRI